MPLINIPHWTTKINANYSLETHSVTDYEVPTENEKADSDVIKTKAVAHNLTDYNLNIRIVQAQS